MSAPHSCPYLPQQWLGLFVWELYTAHERGFDLAWVQFWNPAMRLKSQNSPSIQIKIPMAFVKMGFGYDNSRNIYKVVSMVVEAQSRKTEVRFIA